LGFTRGEFKYKFDVVVLLNLNELFEVDTGQWFLAVIILETL
jgi:hypothetical protein